MDEKITLIDRKVTIGTQTISYTNIDILKNSSLFNTEGKEPKFGSEDYLEALTDHLFDRLDAANQKILEQMKDAELMTAIEEK